MWLIGGLPLCCLLTFSLAPLAPLTSPPLRGFYKNSQDLLTTFGPFWGTYTRVGYIDFMLPLLSDFGPFGLKTAVYQALWEGKLVKKTPLGGVFVP